MPEERKDQRKARRKTVLGSRGANMAPCKLSLRELVGIGPIADGPLTS